MCRANYFFIVIFFRKGRGGGRGVKIGLFVIHNNNNYFNLINIYSTKSITIEYKKIMDLFTVRKKPSFGFRFIFYS